MNGKSSRQIRARKNETRPKHNTANKGKLFVMPFAGSESFTGTSDYSGTRILATARHKNSAP